VSLPTLEFNYEYSIDHRGSRAVVRRRRILFQQTRTLNIYRSNPGKHVRCRDQTWQPPFRVNLASVPLVCSFRRAEIAPAHKPDFQPTDRPVSRKTGLPQDTPRDRTAHRCTPPRLPLHSGSQVSSLRRIRWCDQNGVEFSAKSAPNPTPLSSQKGWRTHGHDWL